MKDLTEEEQQELERFTEELKQIKKNKEEYFRLVTTGHCAICLCELDMPKKLIKTFTTATCSDCQEEGLENVFQKGLLCGMELKEWKKQKRDKE